MVYNSAVLASMPAELMTANKNCKLGLQKCLRRGVFYYNKSGCNVEPTDLWDDCDYFM